MICKWIPIIKHFKGEDVINNVENDAAKGRFLQFFYSEEFCRYKKV